MTIFLKLFYNSTFLHSKLLKDRLLLPIFFLVFSAFFDETCCDFLPTTLALYWCSNCPGLIQVAIFWYSAFYSFSTSCFMFPEQRSCEAQVSVGIWCPTTQWSLCFVHCGIVNGLILLQRWLSDERWWLHLSVNRRITFQI